LRPRLFLDVNALIAPDYRDSISGFPAFIPVVPGGK
jgi:hypothetical protein